MNRLIAFLLLVWIGADARAQFWPNQNTCYFPDAAAAPAPAWVCQPRAVSSGLISTTGYSDQFHAGFAFARQMAVADARIRLAQGLQDQCGRQGTSDAVLRHSRVLNLQRSPGGGLYARVGIRRADLKNAC